MLHTMYVSNGEEPNPAVEFAPPNATTIGLIVANNTAYAITGQCGGPGSVRAVDLTTKTVTTWNAGGARVAGSEGAAIGPDGVLYVATGSGSSTYSSSVVALDPKTLQPKDWFTEPGEDFTSTPVIFLQRNKVLIAAGTKSGHVFLLDAKDLGGPDHKSPLSKSSGESSDSSIAGSLATWQDAQLTQWLLASAGNEIRAWKIVEAQGAAVSVESGWESEKIIAPTSPLIINGVVFAASNAKPGASSAALYALDATNGKQIWKSKPEIKASPAAVSAGAGQVYVTAGSSTLYAYGFPMEH
jgi:hypothetical protein